MKLPDFREGELTEAITYQLSSDYADLISNTTIEDGTIKIVNQGLEPGEFKVTMVITNTS